MPNAPTLRIGKLSEFAPQRRNANRHTPRGMALLESSMQEDGYVAPMTATADNEVIDGSARLEDAAIVFDDEAIVVEHDGQRPVVMKRVDLPNAEDPRARGISLKANRIGQLNLDFDFAAVQELGTGWDITPLWSEEERTEQWAGVGNGTGSEVEDVEPQLDRAEELRKEWGVESGQLWQLGNHRLLCGDSTKWEDVARVLMGDVPLLMVTDPPYGVEYDADWRNHAFREDGSPSNGRAIGKVQNDTNVDWTSAWQLFPGDVAYCWHAGRHASEVQNSLTHAGFEIRCQIIWAKQQFVIGRGDYHWKHEPCWYAVRKGKTGHWSGDRSQTTLWEIDKPIKSETGHSTQKPIECMARPIRNNSQPGDAIYEPFCGSGTTLIASEQLGRKCRAIEISPGYVAVTLQRYADATGKKPTLLQDT